MRLPCRTPLRFVPMTGAQASKVNAALGGRGDPLRLLSPRQRALAAAVGASPTAGWQSALDAPDLTSASAAAEAVANR